MSNPKEEALLALAAKGEVEQKLANLSLYPPSRHAAYAAVVATLVGTPVLPQPIRFVALALIYISIYLIVQWDKRRLGLFISGVRRGKTLMVTLPMFAFVLGLYLASYFLSLSHGKHGIILALAAIAFIMSYLGSTLWQRIFVSELSAR